MKNTYEGDVGAVISGPGANVKVDMHIERTSLGRIDELPTEGLIELLDETEREHDSYLKDCQPARHAVPAYGCFCLMVAILMVSSHVGIPWFITLLLVLASGLVGCALLRAAVVRAAEFEARRRWAQGRVERMRDELQRRVW